MNDVAVVGAGLAGVTAAIYLKRNGLDVALIERKAVGGLARNANLIEDYPGFPGGIPGPELCAKLESQLASAGVVPTIGEVTEIARDGISFSLVTTAGKFQCRTLIVATGTHPETLDVEGADLVRGLISYEVTDMGQAAPGTRVAVIGGGEAALDYALTLRGRGCVPEVFCRGSKIKTNPRLLARFQEAGIPIYLDHSLQALRPADSLIDMTFSDGGGHAAEHILAALGRAPDFPAFGAGLPAEIEIGEDGQTQVPGLLFAGDILRGRDRHVATAVGDGMRAAMTAKQYLETPEALQ